MNARMPHTTGYASTLSLSNVADVQRAINMLRQSGFLHRESIPKPLLEDGSLGPYTRAAITAFQQAVYLPGTGRIDASTRGMLAGALRSIGVQAEPNTPPNAVGGVPIVNISSVSEVQWALNRLDPNAQLPQSGTLDDRTRQALIAFQKTYMLPATGDVDGQTRRTIAQALVRIGIPASAPSTVASTGARPEAPAPIADRSAQIKQQALSALHELREIGLTAVAETLRHLVNDPSVDNLRKAIGFLRLPNSGVFANQVATLWAPVLDTYSKQADADGALRANLPGQMAPLLTQVDTVLGAVNQLAATPTVDNLTATIARLSGQGGPLGVNLAKPMQAFLTSITAPAGASTRA